MVHLLGNSRTTYPAVDDAALTAAAAVSSNDVWALGAHGKNGSPFAQHWNGKAWKSVPVPSPMGSDYTMTAAVAIRGNDVWAVGNGQNGAGDSVAIVEHWNGKAWEPVKSPGQKLELRAVMGTGPQDIWVAGDEQESVINDNRAVAEHWSGSGWTKYQVESHPGFLTSLSMTSGTVWAVGFNLDDVALPTAVAFRYDVRSRKWSNAGVGIARAGLSSIVALSPTNVWAFGYYFEPDIHAAALALHWNGSKWSVSPSPNFGTGDSFQAAAGAGGRSMWAVGYYFDAGAGMWPLALKWNGSSWKRVGVAAKTSLQGMLLATSADSPTDVWAVGTYSTTLGSRPMVEHWNGVTWNARALPVPKRLTANAPPDGIFPRQSISITGVEALASNNVWVAGTWSDPLGFAEAPLVEHWNGTSWSIATTPRGFDLVGRVDAYSAGLLSIAAVNARDIWAVGVLQSGAYDGTYALHWNGAKWYTSIQPRLKVNETGWLDTVAASPAGDLWTGGASLDSMTDALFHWTGYSWDRATVPAHSKIAGMSINAILPLTRNDVWAAGSAMAHFDGHAWSAVADPVTSKGEIYSLAALGAKDIWAVGSSSRDPYATSPAIEQWDGTRWTMKHVAPPSGKSPSFTVRGLASSGSAVWAVGGVADGQPGEQLSTSLVEQFSACAGSG